MYNNESYEEYIRNILGYPNYNNNHFENGNYYQNDYRNQEEESELEACYPEIYRIVYPMITKACLNNTRPISSELIDELTDEIYNSVEPENEIRVNINLNNTTTSTTSVNNRNTPTTANAKTNDKKVEDRQFRNNNLKDLIRILLIRELLGNRPNRPNNRPPFRPPFPGNPGPGPRTQIIPPLNPGIY